MKRFYILLLLLLMILIGFLFFSVDKKLFYYGKNDLSIYKSLPMDMKPRYRYDFEGGFALEDKYNFGLISQGKCQYANSNSNVVLDIKSILKYGFNQDSLIALVEDQDKTQYYVLCTPNHLPSIKQDIIVDVLKQDSFTNQYTGFIWIDLSQKTSNLEFFRNIIVIFSVLIVLLFIFFIKRRPRK